jgi:hypothetical protein
MDPFELLVEAYRPALKGVLARLVDIFRAHDVRYVIGGASALSLYVKPRMTVDIDAFVDAARKDELDRIRRPLRGGAHRQVPFQVQAG